MLKEAWPAIAKAHLKPYIAVRGSAKTADKLPEPTIVQAIFHLIAYYENTELAERALSLFGGASPEHFSSWYEVRLASAREIEDTLISLGATNRKISSVAFQIKQMLQTSMEMFEDPVTGLNEVTDAEQINAFIEQIDWETEWFPDYLRGFWEKITVVEELTTLVLLRLGVVKQEDSLITLRKELKNITGMSGHNAHLLMVATAKNYCKPENPECGSCPCRNDCASAKTNLPVAV